MRRRISALAGLFLRFEVTLTALALAAAWSGDLGYSTRVRTVDIGPVQTTVGDLRALHAEVLVRGAEVRGSARLRDGDEIKTGAGGRARVRLDDGTIVIVDGDATLTLKGARLTLARGRVFVQAGAAGRTEIAMRDSLTRVVSSAAAFDAGDAGDAKSPAKAYCARGELVLTAAGKSAHVQSGETVTVGVGEAKVAPETAFDDWTGGLAVPWSGEPATASALAELWGGAGGVDPGAPLVVRSAKVEVGIDGEVAHTQMRMTYFNGSERQVVADVRMALPEGAIVSKVARVDEGNATEQTATLAVGNPNGADNGRLEWAGGGWLRGTLTGVPAGRSVELAVDYVEWLPQRDGHATYRFPMASDTEAPMVGGLDLRVVSHSPARWLSASTGAAVVGGAIEQHSADLRPTGDLVVELSPDVVKAGIARAYVAPGARGEDPYLLVRTEAPAAAEAGVTLALVVDASASVGPSLLEIERAAVDALLEALGPKDAVVLLVADHGTRLVGPEKPEAVTPELRARLRKGLADVRAGGASNLGLALERAADLLDGEGDRAGSGMVVYLGDGRPTVGESSARDLRKRLARRASGAPRLGALAVGQGADRWLLAEVVAGGGPVYDVLDRPDAARASAALVADALAPTLRDVSVDLGATVDRVYPREPQGVAAGSTLTVAGRLRGEPPKQLALRYRRGTKLVEELRPVELMRVPAAADVARRWAEQRIQESVTHADGLEPGIALASRSGLLTPWTGWYFGGSAGSASWDQRVLGLSPRVDAAFASKVEPAPPPSSLLLEPPALELDRDAPADEASIEQAVELAARRSIRDSMGAMVACRDARASIKPGVSGNLRVEVAVDAEGRAKRVVVRASATADDDPVLNRCVRVVVSAVPFFASGVAVSVTLDLSLPPGQRAKRTQCSVASTLPLAVKRGIWRARKSRGTLDYSEAARACELPTWSDRRTLLGILVAGMAPVTGTALAARFSAEGATDAAAFVRHQLLR
ncbi:MAG TPA: VWA domain-containing protein, partial [Polyangiaceae bacterium]|nr:VWA domain-containing protein [Polyangiaceae bacterium]